MAQACLTALDTWRAKEWREEQRERREEQRRWRQEDVAFRWYARERRRGELLHRQEVRKWRQEQLAQRSLDNALQLWSRQKEANRRAVEEKAEHMRVMSWVAAIVGGFVFTAPVEFTYEGGTDVPGGLRDAYAVATALVPSTMLVSAMIAVFLLGALLRSGKDFVSEAEEEEFLAACRRYSNHHHQSLSLSPPEEKAPVLPQEASSSSSFAGVAPPGFAGGDGVTPPPLPTPGPTPPPRQPQVSFGDQPEDTTAGEGQAGALDSGPTAAGANVARAAPAVADDCAGAAPAVTDDGAGSGPAGSWGPGQQPAEVEQGMELGSAPPCPRRTFEGFWESRCEGDWRLLFQTFSAGITLFFPLLCFMGFIKFFPNVWIPAIFATACSVSCLFWLWLFWTWGRYLTAPSPHTSRRGGGPPHAPTHPRHSPTGTPFDWHIQPSAEWHEHEDFGTPGRGPYGSPRGGRSLSRALTFSLSRREQDPGSSFSASEEGPLNLQTPTWARSLSRRHHEDSPSTDGPSRSRPSAWAFSLSRREQALGPGVEDPLDDQSGSFARGRSLSRRGSEPG